ncbi:MAG: dTDP-4-dehydrorhamnose reductase [Methanomassiliicoccales archaeon]|jgi:dTDP-4-dehydrorhamnose reductase
MERSLVIGGSGLLGQNLVKELKASGEDVLSTYSSNEASASKEGFVKLDIRDPEAVAELLSSFSPRHVYLPAAMTNVDQCERSPTQAWDINAVGTMSVAKACKNVGARLLYVSTDYVFSGMKGSRYYEFDNPDPVNIYGQTKLEGERVTLDADRHNLVCRVSVLYGHNESGKSNFVTWLMGELRKGNKVKVFHDQYVSPTYAPHSAKVLVKLMGSEEKGVLHTSGPDCINRYDMAVAIANEIGMDAALIEKVATADGGLLARRPEVSCLSVDMAESVMDMAMMPFKEGISLMNMSNGN